METPLYVRMKAEEMKDDPPVVLATSLNQQVRNSPYYFGILVMS